MDKEIIIQKKVSNQILTKEELSYFFLGYLNDEITDEEMTRLLKAICKNNLNTQEIIDLTDIFIQSGERIDLKGIKAIDKHSTGGVGDKITLILAPILSSLDIYVAKMSGRALGYTGGTIDKLESIKGFQVNLTNEQFIKELKDIKMAITSQTNNLCPLDKKVYALRDVTNTTENIGLIASSIMSKKIASGASQIFIDVKVGQGALLKTKKDAIKLAKTMVEIGKIYQKKVICMLTRMDNPLGNNIGNAIEVIEVIDILKNNKHNKLRQLVIEMAKEIVSTYKNIPKKEAQQLVEKTLITQKAYQKFLEFISYQHGDINSIKLKEGTKIYSKKTGYIKNINAQKIGMISMQLGAGRIKKEDKIDYQAGIILNKQPKDKIKQGELLCTIYGDRKINEEELLSAFTITKWKPFQPQTIIAIIK